MKKKFYKSTWFIIAVSIFLALILLKLALLSYPEKRRFYTSFYTDRTITMWKTYIIFEKYEGALPPKDNYIRLKTRDKTNIYVFFKDDNTVTIWSELKQNIKTKFDKSGDNVTIYYYPENYQEYCNDCHYSDPNSDVEYEFLDRVGYLTIMMNEITTDTVRVSHYDLGLFNNITRKHRMLFTRGDEHWSRWDR